MDNGQSHSPAASACSCSAQPQSHCWDPPVLRTLTQTEPIADESKKGHSGGNSDVSVCSGSTDATLNPLSYG